MASTSSSSPSSIHNLHQSINPNLLNLLITSINHQINSLISDRKSRKTLQSTCTSNLHTHTHESFDFTEQSVLSNFYWGIQHAEDAIDTKCPKNIQISENMLQSPASLSENGVTGGISNGYLICCSYYYLSLLSGVRGDEMQVAIHFLQAVVVAPGVVRAELAPEVYRTAVEPCVARLGPGFGGGFDGVVKGAMRVKVWLMYQQVVCYGRSPLVMTAGLYIRRRLKEKNGSPSLHVDDSWIATSAKVNGVNILLEWDR